jgi:hypothetical protein
VLSVRLPRNSPWTAGPLFLGGEVTTISIVSPLIVPTSEEVVPS